MDEVDKIIILSLKEIGCDIDDEVESLKQFPTELVVEAAARCIEAIQPGSGIPASLPPSMSVRFRIGASIAQACLDLGFTGEVGYQTFLYSNESDLRRVLMFLIERLPKDGQSEKVLQEPLGKVEKLRRDISATIRKQLEEPWVPSFCRHDGVRWYEDGSFVKEGGQSSNFDSVSLQTGHTIHGCTPQEWREYCLRYLPLVSDQVEMANRLIPSLITLNSRGILAPGQLQKDIQSAENRKQRADRLLSEMERYTCGEVALLSSEAGLKSNSRFALSQRLQFAAEKSPEKKKTLPAQGETSDVSAAAEVEKKKKEEEFEAEVERLKEENEAIRVHVEQLQTEAKTLSAKLPKTLEEADSAEQSLKESATQQAVRRKVLELLPDADTNLEKLQRVIDTSTQKLVNLASQWEKHRAPLLQQYREARKLHSSRASESARQSEALRNTREKIAELSEELRNKEELYGQLKIEYARVSKEKSRSAYTRRIMEIIGNISKQKEEIEKVLKDTKELHKEINSLAGKLDRSFTYADDLIYRDAKRDEVSKRAYKLLVTLHSDCEEIVKMVEETGANVRESRDLEDQIDTENAKNVSANLERISADLRQMKQETAALAAQLKVKS